MLETLLAMDGGALIWIQENLRADWLTPVILTITKLGNTGKIWIALSLLLLCFKKTRTAGIAGIFSLICSLVLNNMVLKSLVARTRPYEVVEGLISLVGTVGGYSFPSGHTSSSFACAAAVCLVLRKSEIKWRWFFVVLAVVMGFTRLYVGVHYPTDVLGGICIGALCGYIGYRMAEIGLKCLKYMTDKRRHS